LGTTNNSKAGSFLKNVFSSSTLNMNFGSSAAGAISGRD
jgi:hypothetical protein